VTRVPGTSWTHALGRQDPREVGLEVVGWIQPAQVTQIFGRLLTNIFGCHRSCGGDCFVCSEQPRNGRN
jgi:hypothetical protein